MCKNGTHCPVCASHDAIRAAFGRMERRSGGMQYRPGAEYVGYLRAYEDGDMQECNPEDFGGFVAAFATPEAALLDFFSENDTQLPADGEWPMIVRVRLVVERAIDPATTRRSVRAGVAAQAEAVLPELERRTTAQDGPAWLRAINRREATTWRRRLREAKGDNRTGQ